ncbi:hypothetical protein [Dyella mobilis]|uniref:Transferrin-binding protein B C-lobe/N-lobe beta barrel domain-containing protein n=1 Tax=Dyella mobilis TaxID=1849582 RepID=A0ABS2KBF1_9GAMM|nr:hypothetical protein [Dyella mobilis]MBM7128505.1 hypothetical protein [Dyella mobilis]GLQ99594.1 hypothetical protein GCM10007863_40140 [Dyella mobilis]
MRTDAAGSSPNYNDDTQSLQNENKQNQGNAGPQIKPNGNAFAANKNNPWSRPAQPTPPPANTPTSPSLPGQFPSLSSALQDSQPSGVPQTQPVPGVTGSNNNGVKILSSIPINPGALPSNAPSNGDGANHLLYNDWSIDTGSKALDNLHFPMKIDDSAKTLLEGDHAPNGGNADGRIGGNFFFQQFSIKNSDGSEPNYGNDNLGGRNAAYIGIQPSATPGKAIFRFAGFGEGITTSTGLGGADGGPGAQNNRMLDFQYSHKYDLSVEADKSDPHVLNGYVQDVTDPQNPGPKQFIGNLRYSNPVKLSTDGGSVVEQGGSRTTGSNQIHYVKGTYYNPYSLNEAGNQENGSYRGHWYTDTGQGPYKDSITGTSEQIMDTDPKSGKASFGLSFEVAGAGWKPGTPIPALNTSDDARPWDPNETIYEGQNIEYNGFVYRAKESFGPSSGPGADSRFLPAFEDEGYGSIEDQIKHIKESKDGSSRIIYAPPGSTAAAMDFDPTKTYKPGDFVRQGGECLCSCRYHRSVHAPNHT